MKNPTAGEWLEPLLWVGVALGVLKMTQSAPAPSDSPQATNDQMLTAAALPMFSMLTPDQQNRVAMADPADRPSLINAFINSQGNTQLLPSKPVDVLIDPTFLRSPSVSSSSTQPGPGQVSLLNGIRESRLRKRR